MDAIYTLSINCVCGVYLKEPSFRLVELQSTSTLGELHNLIQKLTGFDDDHMATFYLANTFRGAKVWLAEDDGWEENPRAPGDGPLWQIRLHDLFPLPKHKKLFYWFDFGDDWILEIVKKGKDATACAGVKYPKLIAKQGPKPEQYPDWEDE
jgi:hypothetical protein